MKARSNRVFPIDCGIYWWQLADMFLPLVVSAILLCNLSLSYSFLHNLLACLLFFPFLFNENFCVFFFFLIWIIPWEFKSALAPRQFFIGQALVFTMEVATIIEHFIMFCGLPDYQSCKKLNCVDLQPIFSPVFGFSNFCVFSCNWDFSRPSYLMPFYSCGLKNPLLPVTLPVFSVVNIWMLLGMKWHNGPKKGQSSLVFYLKVSCMGHFRWDVWAFIHLHNVSYHDFF